MNVSKNDIAIIGMGAHYPGALDIKKLWENIVTKKEQFRRFPDKRLPIDVYTDLSNQDKDKSYVTQGAFLDGFEFDWLGYRIPKKTVESSDIVHWLTYEVAQIALKDAGYTKDNITKDKTGVILGNTLTGEETRTAYLRQRWPYVERVMKSAAADLNLSDEQAKIFIERSEEYYKSVFPEMTEDSLAGGLANTIAGRVCNTMDLHGGGYTVDGACSSSLIAISTAAEKLSSGTLDLAIAGGVDVSLDTFEMVGFARTGALTPDKMRVYDKRGNGFMPGEGCGLIVMKRLEDAKRDGDKIYATIKGWGMSSDGKGGMTAPSGKYQALALQRAYDMAGYSAKDLDFIEGHGTGTTVGDREEIKGIAINIGTEPKNDLRSCGLTSFKSISGHTKAASGIAGLIKATLALNQRIIPPTAGCEQPNLSFNEPEGKGLYPILLGEKCDPSRKLRAGVSAMGFGGINTHITLESADAPFEELKSELPTDALLVTTQKSEVYPLAADSVDTLIALVKSLKKEAFGMSVAELPDLASKCSQRLLNGDIRVTIIANHPNQLNASLAKLLTYLKEETLKNGEMIEVEANHIFLASALNKTKLGFVYPGQGSQQINMARNLIKRFDWAKEMLYDADKILKESGWEDKSLSTFIYKSTDRAKDEEQKEAWFAELTNTDVAQPAICFASSLWTERLKRLGIEPNVVGGHSLGELSAFSAAGAFEYKSLISLAQLRGTAMQNTPSKGSMAAILSSLENVKSMLSTIDGYLTVANINSPEQIVVSGDNEAINALVSLAVAQEIRAKKLNVSNAFHSKLVEEASSILHAKAPISKELHSQCKIISSVTTKRAESNMNMVKYFGDQVLSQVDFVGLVNEMRKECDIFLEVGPGRVLSGMISYIDKELIALPVEAEATNDISLNKIVAYYFVSGGEVNWSELYDSRLIREFTPASEKKFLESYCEEEFNVSKLPANTSDIFHSANNVSSQNGISSLTNVIETLQMIEDSKILNAVQALNGSIVTSNTNTVETSPIKETPLVVEEEKSTEVQVEQKKDSTNKVKDVLLSKISEMTGFPEDSLDLDLKLLDDLNLDSIKATELIVETTQELNLEIELDHSTLSNASLEEIINRLNDYLDNETENAKEEEVLLAKISEMTGFPIESLDLDLKLLDDLNLDSIKATELIVETTETLGLEIDLDPSSLANATLAEIIEVLKNNNGSNKKSTVVKKYEKPWVRNFIMKARHEELSTNKLSTLIALKENSRVLIISDEENNTLANSLNEHIDMNSNNVSISSFTFKELQNDTKLLNESNLEYIFILLPQEKSTDSNTKAIDNMVEKLATLSSLKEKTTVCFAQFAGGLFGTDESKFDIEQTGCLAWASSLHLEQKLLKVRVVDFEKNVNKEEFAKKLIMEVSTEDEFSSSGYKNDMKRNVFRPEVHQSKLDLASKIEWNKNDIILVTGGAKGITAECAFAFANTTGVQMALVGSSKLPASTEKSEINETLAKFEKQGLKAQYYSCDLASKDAVNKLINDIQSAQGDITGIIHGAGLNNPSPLSYVSVDKAKKEIAPKVQGAINLLEAFETKPLKMFTALTSIIGVSGMIGNGWYGFSNEVLDLLVAQYGAKHPKTKTLSIAYSVWGETGMGAKMGSTDYLAKMGIMAIPTAEGIDRFLELVLFDAPARQVVVTAKLAGLDTWKPKKLVKPYSNRYLENIVYEYPSVNVISKAHLTLEKDTYLKDHVWKGSNLFPTVFGLEAMAQVVAYMMEINDFKNLKIEDIKLDRPIVVDKTNGLTIQINALVLEEESEINTKIKVTISTEKSQFQTEHFSAVFVLNGAKDFNTNIEGLPVYEKNRLNLDAKKDLYSWLLFQGPSFQRLSDFYQIDNDMMIFDSKTEESEEKKWMLGSPYLRDSLLQSVQPMVPEHSCLPVKIDALYIEDISKPLPNKIRGISYNEALVDREYKASVYALNAEGQVHEKLEGYRLQIVDYRDEFPKDIIFNKNTVQIEKKSSKRINDLVKSVNNKTESVICYVPTLSKMERAERHNIIKLISEKWFKSMGLETTLLWNDENKPLLDNHEFSISISHTNSYLFMQILEKNAGCDIEHIINRSTEKWSKLLHLKNENYQNIMQQFIENGDDEDTAGTRLWTIREAIYKAIGDFYGTFKLEMMKNNVAKVVLQDKNNSLQLISFPIESERGANQMIAFTITDESNKV